ncbi:hypothetical protein TPHA_0D04100 [Tetrapisispora phaffii CBS 4417]|uniref:Copper transport protein n=1 Tax=Tetrapisispora phaffii (strain ATCC 24235 / CBS 4417 / NBRC 1672 / NRRL Y-8282 / UCD 70-5) TaxID=1071381 RepID=G8BT72_TETPH|nr:hypothetical protein TPHA_0D04100 [Tetrapisispora phaffii CBS 4417]CCE63043.1 hypothetical protein TPHA_0D04100 [Tetrapisispora phaffii CBS 4417]
MDMTMASEAMSSSISSSMSSSMAMAMSSAMDEINASMSSMMAMTMSGMSSSMGAMGSTATASAATSSSTSGMAMSGMDMGMDMDMEMNSYLTINYNKYPVLFKNLYADTNAKAFGIFVLIMVACFFYKFLLFTSWCLEVHWFKTWNKNDKKNDVNALRYPQQSAAQDGYLSDSTLYTPDIPRLPNILAEIFMPNVFEYGHDILRLVLTFCSTLLIYMLMLICMTFVLTYLFGVVLGLTLAEIFFNRCKLCLLKRWEIKKEIDRINKCPGSTNCECGRHKNTAPGTKACKANAPIQPFGSNSSNMSSQFSLDNDKDLNFEGKQDGCCCTVEQGSLKDETNEDRCECGDARDSISNELMGNVIPQQDQSDMMNSTLLPPEKVLK